MKVILFNRDLGGSVFVEMRFSDALRPYAQCPIVPGFPIEIGCDENVQIDPGNAKELLYRRSQGGIERVNTFWSGIFRIAISFDREVQKAYLWDSTSVMAKLSLNEN